DDHTSSSSQIDRLEHQVFGLRGVNNAIYRREDGRVGHPEVIVYGDPDPETGDAPIISDTPAYTDGPDGVFDKSIFQLSDAQGSVVCVIAGQAFTAPNGNAYTGGRTLKTLEYDPYGRSRNIPIGNFDHTGTLATSDIFDFLSAWYAPSPAADQNDNGTLE